MANYKLPGGSRKGRPNRTGAAVKAMVMGALDELGGQDYLVQQAKANPVAFLTLLGKLLPQRIDLDVDLPALCLEEMTDEQLYALAGTVTIDGNPDSDPTPPLVDRRR